jgi:hypothetical protein
LKLMDIDKEPTVNEQTSADVMAELEMSP